VLLKEDPDVAGRPFKAWIVGEALFALNRGPEALAFAAKVETELPRSMVGAWLRFRGAQQQGDTAAARAIAKERLALPDASGYGFGRQPVDWLLLGRLRLAMLEDAKSVLKFCFERALEEDPQGEEAVEAIVELALERGDARMAADKAREGIKKFPGNPRLQVLLGQALEWTSQKEAVKSWKRALELEPASFEARVALARNAFEREDAELLTKELRTLPEWEAEVRALRLARALTGGDTKAAGQLHAKVSRQSWVLHRAGLLLSGRYRFEEGAQLQREALALDPSLLAAKRALAEDLLRTAKSDEAWPLLEEVQKLDGYDVTTFNLLELKDRIAGFTKLETQHFEVWMSPLEAPVYGDRVGQLLEKAFAALAPKYAFQPKGRTRVEIFPEQKDFAVRTFGVPGGDGYLGVCFGPVITAPSPASPRATGHSWEATLWHEFTHTITLTLTRNRLPRWLSEGVSVYEEQQANPAWGRRFRPRHASRLSGSGLTPIEEMPEAFRSGDSADLDFAYLQSGLMVEWLVKRSGMGVFRKLLADVGRGMDADEAIAKHYGAFVTLNPEFRKYAAEWTRGLAGKLVWKGDSQREPEAAPVYQELVAEGRRELRSNNLEGARKALETAVWGAPAVSDAGVAYSMLAEVYRSLGLESEETALWEAGLALEADLEGAHERLMELAAQRGDWARVEAAAVGSLGVNPMSLTVLERLWKARSELGRAREAADACVRALALDAARAPRWHARLGLLLEGLQPEEARRHLLEALESNPRDRAALEALSRLSATRKQEGKVP
jgi:tetratricopeptide (TPR) repeat protein